MVDTPQQIRVTGRDQRGLYTSRNFCSTLSSFLRAAHRIPICRRVSQSRVLLLSEPLPPLYLWEVGGLSRHTHTHTSIPAGASETKRSTLRRHGSRFAYHMVFDQFCIQVPGCFAHFWSSQDHHMSKAQNCHSAGASMVHTENTTFSYGFSMISMGRIRHAVRDPNVRAVVRSAAVSPWAGTTPWNCSFSQGF